MGAKIDPEADFISGIFNYCDRWCERCPMTSRCLLYFQESRQRSEYLSNGEDPDNLEIVLKDVEENLKQAMDMCRQLIEDEEIEVDEPEEPIVLPERIDLSGNPIHIKAHKFAMDCHHFLDPLSSYLHEEENNGADPSQMAHLQDCFEVLSWYHMQIAVKLDRALSGKDGQSAMDGYLNDRHGSAKVAYLGLLRSLDALTKVYEQNKPMHTDIMPLLNEIYELIEDVDLEFPGHKTFKRPGFDQ